MKQWIENDHFPVNKYCFTVSGLSYDMYPSKISGIDSEISVVELPDRTKVSGGDNKPLEIVISLMAHHKEEIQQMFDWYYEAKDMMSVKQQEGGVSETYKKSGTVTLISHMGKRMLEFTLSALWCSKYKAADLDAADEGTANQIEFTLQCDEINEEFTGS